MTLPPDLRVAVVHDYLTQRGGAERVALAMLEAFPGARLVTSLYEPAQTFQDFRNHHVEVLPLHLLPPLRRDPRVALPALPWAFSRAVLDDVDVVLCSSSGFAHGVRTPAPKIVYCHNPARWLYQTDEYMANLPPAAQRAFTALAAPLRRWDRRAALEASAYLVNSRTVLARVHEAYGIEAALLPPPVVVDPDGRLEPVSGIEPGYLLTVGRLRGYKNTGVVAEAVAGLPGERLVAVGGLPVGDWPQRLIGLEGVNDGQLRWLYRNAAALIAASYEDFGLTPIEAYSNGTPAITLEAGGYLDTSEPEITGPTIPAPPTSAGIQEAIRAFRARSWDADRIREHSRAWDREHFAGALTQVVERVLSEPRPQSRHAIMHPPAGRSRRVIVADRRGRQQPIDDDRRRG